MIEAATACLTGLNRLLEAARCSASTVDPRRKHFPLIEEVVDEAIARRSTKPIRSTRSSKSRSSRVDRKAVTDVSRARISPEPRRPVEEARVPRTEAPYRGTAKRTLGSTVSTIETRTLQTIEDMEQVVLQYGTTRCPTEFKNELVARLKHAAVVFEAQRVKALEAKKNNGARLTPAQAHSD